MTTGLLEWQRSNDVKIDHFQVFGERRCGTNFVDALISDNLTAQSTTKYGWKHGTPTMPCIAKNGLLVVVVREPFAWLSSLHNRPFAMSHKNLDMSAFLRTEWYDQFIPKEFGHARWGYSGMVRDSHVANQVDRHPITGKRFQNPLEMRTIKNAAFLGFLNRECNCAVVNYETANDRPDDFLAALCAEFGLEPRHAFEKPDHVGAKGTTKKRLYRDDLSAEDIAFVQANLDPDQETRLGYASSLE